MIARKYKRRQDWNGLGFEFGGVRVVTSNGEILGRMRPLLRRNTFPDFYLLKYTYTE